MIFPTGSGGPSRHPKGSSRGGRAINPQEPGWEKTLTGVPMEIHQLWDRHFRARGYKLKAGIVSFPNGMPGDVGMTLKWD